MYARGSWGHPPGTGIPGPSDGRVFSCVVLYQLPSQGHRVELERFSQKIRIAALPSTRKILSMGPAFHLRALGVRAPPQHPASLPCVIQPAPGDTLTLGLSVAKDLSVLLLRVCHENSELPRFPQ